MGLDMYLSRRRYVKNWDYMKDEQRHEVTLRTTRHGVTTEVPLTNVTYIEEEVGYWRKANQVHQFFVNLDGGRDECQNIPVEREHLVDLLDRCKKILADRTLAPQLLPTQRGFFFGSTEYDEWYFEDIENTVRIIEPLIADSPKGEWFEYVYRASW